MEAHDGGPAVATHVHEWSQMRFELVADKPVVRQTCVDCRFERRYRAWERYWDPGASTEQPAYGPPWSS